MASKKPAAAAPAPEKDARTSLDVEALRQIVEILEASEVTRLFWRRGNERLVIRRGPLPVHTVVQPVSAGPAVTVTAPAPAELPKPAAAAPKAETPAAEKPGQLVTSPFVGTFYRTPAPDQPPFVDVGTVVKKGQVLCIIEAMKLMNEIEAETPGKITEVLAQNGIPVEFGQPLFRIEPV